MNSMVTLSPPMIRIFALIVGTSLFVGAWTNDRPISASTDQTREVAAGTREDDRVLTSQINTTEGTPVNESMTSAALTDSRAKVEISIRVSGVEKTFEVDASQLLITDEVLQAHLDQLPLGLEVGDYRIVDELGGVGWLRVRTDRELSGIDRSGRLFSTTVDENSVQFIRIVAPAAISERSIQRN